MKLARVFVVRMYGSRQTGNAEGVVQPLGGKPEGFTTAEALWRVLTAPGRRAPRTRRRPES